MSQADEILAQLLALDVEHPRYFYEGMRLCYWCGAAWCGADIPQNHHDDCPWFAARTWAKRNSNKVRAARERREATIRRETTDDVGPDSASSTSPGARGPLDVPVGQLL